MIKKLCLSYKQDILDKVISKKTIVKCLNNGNYYESILEAANKLNIDKYALYDSIVLDVTINKYKLILGGKNDKNRKLYT